MQGAILLIAAGAILFALSSRKKKPGLPPPAPGPGNGPGSTGPVLVDEGQIEADSGDTFHYQIWRFPDGTHVGHLFLTESEFVATEHVGTIEEAQDALGDLADAHAPEGGFVDPCPGALPPPFDLYFYQDKQWVFSGASMAPEPLPAAAPTHTWCVIPHFEFDDQFHGILVDLATGEGSIVITHSNPDIAASAAYYAAVNFPVSVYPWAAKATFAPQDPCAGAIGDVDFLFYQHVYEGGAWLPVEPFQQFAYDASPTHRWCVVKAGQIYQGIIVDLETGDGTVVITHGDPDVTASAARWAAWHPDGPWPWPMLLQAQVTGD